MTVRRCRPPHTAMDELSEDEFHQYAEDQLAQVAVNDIFLYDIYINYAHSTIVCHHRVRDKFYRLHAASHIVQSVLEIDALEARTLTDMYVIRSPSNQPEYALPYDTQTIHDRTWSDLYACDGAIQFNIHTAD
jgi:hypothetical protein